jgi:hypothetical protein
MLCGLGKEERKGKEIGYYSMFLLAKYNFSCHIKFHQLV